MSRQGLGGGHGVDGGGEVKVFVGKAAGVVGAERERDLVVADEDVWVVVHALGLVGERVDKGDGRFEVGEADCALDRVSGLGPVGGAAKGRVNVGLGQSGHHGAPSGRSSLAPDRVYRCAG